MRIILANFKRRINLLTTKRQFAMCKGMAIHQRHYQGQVKPGRDQHNKHNAPSYLDRIMTEMITNIDIGHSYTILHGD